MHGPLASRHERYPEAHVDHIQRVGHLFGSLSPWVHLVDFRHDSKRGAVSVLAK